MRRALGVRTGRPVLCACVHAADTFPRPADRLSKFEIRVGDDSSTLTNNALCYYTAVAAPAGASDWLCNGGNSPAGRYLSIQLKQQEFLTLGEVSARE